MHYSKGTVLFCGIGDYFEPEINGGNYLFSVFGYTKSRSKIHNKHPLTAVVVLLLSESEIFGIPNKSGGLNIGNLGFVESWIVGMLE